MGSLKLPAAGLVYADAEIASTRSTSTPYMHRSAECSGKPRRLVGSMRSGDHQLAANREALWRQDNARLLPIGQDVLREAARLRASCPAPFTFDFRLPPFHLRLCTDRDRNGGAG